ncbi:hypothetical protein ACQP1U_06255 [Actinomycetota bacterium]
MSGETSIAKAQSATVRAPLGFCKLTIQRCSMRKGCSNLWAQCRFVDAATERDVNDASDVLLVEGSAPVALPARAHDRDFSRERVIEEYLGRYVVSSRWVSIAAQRASFTQTVVGEWLPMSHV